MSVDAPFITTIIPTYRRPHLLRRAIQSVLQQSYQHLRVCVYDNASGDDTAAIVEGMARIDPRIIYHRHPENIGMIPNFNHGLAQVQTPLFSLLCDDDLLLPRFYEQAVAIMKSYPDAALVSTSVINMDQGGNFISETPTMPPGYYSVPDGVFAMTQFSKAPITGSLIRSDILAKVGLFDPQVGTAFDFDLELRIAAHFPIVISAQPGAAYTVHETSASVTARFEDTWANVLRISSKFCEDMNVAPVVRTRVSQTLSQQVEQYLFRAGIICVLRKDVAQTRAISDIFQGYYHQRRKAFILRVLAWMGEHAPFAYTLMRRAQLTRKRRQRQAVSARYADLRREVSWLDTVDQATAPQ